LLKPGDRIWVKAPGYGFVGVGRVKGLSTPGREFRINVDGEEKLAPDVLTSEIYKRAPRTMTILSLDLPPLWRDARFHC
jgi:hypothetical protein